MAKEFKSISEINDSEAFDKFYEANKKHMIEF